MYLLYTYFKGIYSLLDFFCIKEAKNDLGSKNARSQKEGNFSISSVFNN